MLCISRISNGQGVDIKNLSSRSVLTVNNMTEDHFGNYTCVATNKLGMANASVSLIGELWWFDTEAEFRVGKSEMFSPLKCFFFFATNVFDAPSCWILISPKFWFLAYQCLHLKFHHLRVNRTKHNLDLNIKQELGQRGRMRQKGIIHCVVVNNSTSKSWRKIKCFLLKIPSSGWRNGRCCLDNQECL